jgi:hypothetical protein
MLAPLDVDQDVAVFFADGVSIGGSAPSHA